MRAGLAGAAFIGSGLGWGGLKRVVRRIDRILNYGGGG